MAITAAENATPATSAARESGVGASPEKTDKPADKRRALGRGLDSLLPVGPSPVRENRASWGNQGAVPPPGNEVAGGRLRAEIPAPEARTRSGDAVLQMALDQIDPNPYQTRTAFDQESLAELAESIRSSGVVQPIVVRPAAEGRYVLVLGERRCRASKLAGKATVPAIVRPVSDQQAAEMTVVENLQREDLNCLEQASAFAKLSKDFNLTQQQIGDRVGLSRESVSNYMRLLKLPPTVLQYLLDGMLGFCEARELLKLEDAELIAKIAKQTVDKHLSLSRLVDLIEDITSKRHLAPQSENTRGARWVDPNVRAAQAELEKMLGVRVRIRDRKGKGRIVIEYATLEDYDRVVGMLKGQE
jgi:ParB family chromosome partitioning protein